MSRRHKSRIKTRFHWSRSIGRGATLGLLGIALGQWAGSQPARAGDDAPVAPSPPFESIYVPEESTSAMVLHPSALARQGRTFAPLADLIDEFNALSQNISATVAQNRPDVTRPAAAPTLEFAAIETVVMGFKTQITMEARRDPAEVDEYKLGCQSCGFAIRTVAPFDWLGLLRALPLSLQTVQDGDRTYHTIVVPRRGLGSWEQAVDLPFAVLVPDERTVVINSASFIKTLIHRTTPAVPPALQGNGWARLSQGLAAVTLDNTDDALTRPIPPLLDDPKITLLIERSRGVERITLGIDADDAGVLTLQAEGLARDESLARSLAASVGLSALIGRGMAGWQQPRSPSDANYCRVVNQFLQRVQVGSTDRAVNLTVRDFVTYADLAAVFATAGDALDPAVLPAGFATLPAVPMLPDAPLFIAPAPPPGELRVIPEASQPVQPRTVGAP